MKREECDSIEAAHAAIVDSGSNGRAQAEKPKCAAVDVIVPVYGERSDALLATLEACLKQTYPVSKVFVVDDGSPLPVSLPEPFGSNGKIRLIRLSANQGISAARNAAISQSSAEFLACVNVDVVPNEDWLAACVDYMEAHPAIGACYTRIVPAAQDRLLSRWRMQFQEQKYGEQSGPAPFAPGHAVLFSKRAVDSVEGYDVRRRRITEDSDICERIRQKGYETHYVAQSGCTSIQQDTLSNLCKKQLARGGWSSPQDYPFLALVRAESKWLSLRLARNAVNLRWKFIPIDFAVWVGSLVVASRKTLNYRRGSAS
jgi:cellulose synthase/poly-beta-1,6-N-acetylglucosamine synthase-like glycosyltransferase